MQAKNRLREAQHAGVGVDSMVDIPATGVGRNDDGGYPQAVHDVWIGSPWRFHMVVKATPVVPREDDSRLSPLLGIAHDGIDLTHGPILTVTDATQAGMVANALRFDQPAYGR